MNPSKNIHEIYSLHTRNPLENEINSSISHNPTLYTNRLSNNINLTNNYAPVEKILADTIKTRNIHPIARYVEDQPLYPDMFYNDKSFGQLVEAENKNNKPKLDAMFDDIVRIDHSKNNKFDQNVVTPKRYDEMVKSTQNQNYLNPQTNLIRQINNNKEYINQVILNGFLSKESFKPTTTSTSLDEIYKENFSMRLGRKGNFQPINQKQQGKQQVELKPREIFKLPKKSNNGKIKITTRKESFTKENEDDNYTDQVYIQSLETRLISVIHYVKSNNTYKYWNKNWEALEKAIKDSNFSFSRLDGCDSDIAYTINKGEKTKFRIRDKDRKYVPLNIYQYVMLHEAAHCANFKNWGHGREFCELLSILCLASYELGYINLQHMQKEIYLTNGQPILCQSDMKSEIISGIHAIINKNPQLRNHYEELIEHIKRR